MENIKKRFLEILAEKRIGPTEFGAAMGIPQSSVSRTFNKSDVISKVDYYLTLQELTECNLNWVIAGIGEKYLVKVPEGMALAAEDSPPYSDMKLMFDTYKNMAEQNETLKEQITFIMKKLEKL